MRTIGTLLRVLATAITLLAPAQAAGTVGIDPAAKLYTATPGGVIDATLKVYNPNPTKETLKVVTYFSDFTETPDGQTNYQEPGSHPRSASNWITVNPSELELTGQQTQELRYTIRVPEGLEAGTYLDRAVF
ncbi:hypothetical protein HNR42_003336 [Deinobacterium chartae]|uniref:Uncharacterized protein n=1 Tax=Deinobacterium chartae TaxID=521158 RepID=A0A841I4C4_9DEIO|nr:hypothetical protein [Deinobacterium chartae]MBB6099876.1 hypothetical protein [Deinobacterium chartae]